MTSVHSRSVSKESRLIILVGLLTSYLIFFSLWSIVLVDFNCLRERDRSVLGSGGFAGEWDFGMSRLGLFSRELRVVS